MALFESKLHSIVINKPNSMKYVCKDEFCKIVSNWLDNSYRGVKCMWICHDRDIVHLDNSTDYQFKTIHIHLVMMFPKKAKTQSIISDLISYLVDCNYIYSHDEQDEVKNCFSDKRIYDLNMACRYLLHLDDSDKCQYPIDELYYSNDNLLEYLSESLQLNWETLVLYVKESTNYTDLLARLGLEKTMRYNRVIEKLWYYYKGVKL